MTEPSRAVFLSYASQDAEAAKRICEALRAGGIEVWFDQSELRGGDAWDAAIRRQIKSCALFIPLISLNTLARIEGYFRLEWKLAIDRSHLIAPDQAFLLPVAIDSTSQSSERIPERFRELQWTRLSEGTTSLSFVARVADLLSADHSRVSANDSATATRSTTHLTVKRHHPRKTVVSIGLTITVVAVALLAYALRNTRDAHVPLAADNGAATSPGVAPVKSIAVLPFENLSDDKSNAYFSAGIQEEILSRLAGVGDLKVISRTSTEKYKSRPDNLRNVAAELGVSNVLEGSVQKAGDKVRINVQLIDATRDTHLWANIYDRDVKDVFAVESEVSQNIADALKATLSPRETQALAALPTTNSAAYDLFLKGEYELNQALNTEDGKHYDSAEDFYRQATKLDPQFAQAYAKFAIARLNRHWFVKALTPAELAEVKTAADQARTLRPDIPDAYEALGLYHYYGFRDYARALTEFEKVIGLQPNNTAVLHDQAAVYRRTGEWARSIHEFERAVELAPLDAFLASDYGATLVMVRRYADADRVLKRALALNPQVTIATRFLATNFINGYGDIKRARALLDAVPPGLMRQDAHLTADISTIDQRIYLQVLERRFPEALDALQRPSESGEDHLRPLFAQITVRIVAGQRMQAQADCRELRGLREQHEVQEIDKPGQTIEQSWIELCLGDNARAIAMAHKAAELLPLSRDAFYGAYYLIGLAQIETQAGDPEGAINVLTQLMSIPAGHTVSVERLKLDPVWDPLRGNLRFQALLSSNKTP